MADRLDPAVQSCIVSERQLAADRTLVPCDILGTAAHVVMLHHCRIITTDIAARLLAALRTLTEEHAAGRFRLDPEKGAQLSLEARLIALAGPDAGLSAHTARSRNDQVALTELLHLREQATATVHRAARLCGRFLKLAARHRRTVFPGYTHMQPAKPTSFGHWCLAHNDALLRALDGIESACGRYDLNPLGAVESFGTSWPIDRRFTTRLLGFADVWQLPQDAITSRGMFQLALITGLEELVLVAGRVAADLLFYTTFECAVVELGDNVARRMHPITGSSVMAQKRNPDVLELIRAAAPQLGGLRQAVAGLLARLPSGYNRDPREIKEHIAAAFEKTDAAVTALDRVIATLTVNRGRARELVERNYSLTTDFADRLARETGAPYRLVYRVVGTAVNRFITEGRLLNEITAADINRAAAESGVGFTLPEGDPALMARVRQALDPEQALESRRHIGGTSLRTTELQVERQRGLIARRLGWVKRQQANQRRAQRRTWAAADRIIKLAR